MTRWKAAAIHLAISAGVAGCAVVLFVLAWFPPPHFGTGGGLGLLRIIAMVDVVLGPLLTLVVYRAGKKGLRFDLTVIGLLQAGALAYGLSVAHGARAVYIVVTPDRATLVRASDVHPDPRPTLYREPPFHGIQLVALRRLEGTERSRMVEAVMDGAPDIDYRPAFYLPPRGNVADVAAKAEPLAKRIHADPAHAACYRRWLSNHDVADPSPLRILPMIGADLEAEAVIDTAAGTLVGYLPTISSVAAECR